MYSTVIKGRKTINQANKNNKRQERTIDSNKTTKPRTETETVPSRYTYLNKEEDEDGP